MSKIEEQVMGSVAVIYAARALFSITAFKVYALVLSLGGIVAFVSVPHVASNFVNVAQGGGVGSVALFVVSAVVSTTLLVQLALMVGAVAALLLVVPVVFRTHTRSFA